MSSRKRSSEDSAAVTSRKSKKLKADAGDSDKPTPVASSIMAAQEVDFPRGGGTSFTPLEMKQIRDEAIKEAKDELFKEAKSAQRTAIKRKRSTKDVKTKGTDVETIKPDHIRIEHLNYKRIHTGMKIYGQVQYVQPMYLIISLPNQLFAHVPVTNVSTQLLKTLETEDSDAEEEEEEENGPVSDLSDIFTPGQYVRSVVQAVHPAGYTDPMGLSKSRDDIVRASRRVELSLLPEKVNAGLKMADLVPGFTMTASIGSLEDHGYLLDLGLPEVSGFLPFKDDAGYKRRVGQLVDIYITKLSPNKRTVTVSAKTEEVAKSTMTEVSSVSSILPGSLVSCLVTTANAVGVNVRIMGFFDGTIEQQHFERSAEPKIGAKVKARILYDLAASPPRFALSLLDHIVRRDIRRAKNGDDTKLMEKYSAGTILEEVKVESIEAERGLFVQCEDGLSAFVHISDISDDHLLSISPTSSWKVGSLHRARVIGYYALDGMLRLSMKPSLLQERLYQVTDVQVGEVIKGTVKRLTDSALFVSISKNFDGVVWPNHYADITLKHPSKRFKVGGTVKCRVLVVDQERKRVSLTAKKSLIDSTTPIITSFEDAVVGVVTTAVVFKVSDKGLMVEFFNNIKATVHAKEASEQPLASLSEAFSIGKVVQVRILKVDPTDKRISASIKKASSTFTVFNSDISAVEVGNTIQAEVHEIRPESAILSTIPSSHRATISLANVSNARKISVAQLRKELKVGDKLDDLLVVSKDSAKALLIVAMKPKANASSKNSLSIDTVAPGQLVSGRVTRHVPQGSLVKLSARIGGILHPTDVGDDFSSANPFPAIDSIVKATVISVDKDKKQLTLSTRRSKMQPEDPSTVIDREITTVADLDVGQSVRGFVKNITDHGIFVAIGRGVDARVQIRELFDDYVKEWKGRFQINQVVKGRILSVNSSDSRVELTLRVGELKKAGALILENLTVGQKVEGKIKRVEEYGLFIQFDGSKLTGLCHKSELSDNSDSDPEQALKNFREGDSVEAVVIKVEQKRISLSMKPSLCNPQDREPEDHIMGSISEEDEEPEQSILEPESSIEGDSDDDETPTVKAVSPQQFQAGPSRKSTSEPSGPTLPLSGGFQWTTPASGNDAEIDSSDNASSGEEDGGRKKRRRKKAIEQDLTAEMHTKMPESNADFERLLLGSPNSSFLWMQYMSFQLQLSEVEKAREIARRALEKIHFREEQEKQNIWIALLNLECSYGTEASLEATFQEAARASDSKTIHLRLAMIFDQSERHQKAEDQYKRTSKKFGHSSKVWCRFSEHYLRQGKLQESRQLLPRALQSLEKRKHLKTISIFAQLEYKLGEPERGKTLFEGIMDSHPKRWDFWSIYMDMQAGQNDIQSLRGLFERVLSIKMTNHKAKSFFKKWLELERKIGDDEGAEVVKQKAVEWAQRAGS